MRCFLNSHPPHKTLHPIPMKHLCLTKQCGLFGRGELAAVDGCDVCRMEATEGFVDGLLAKLGTETAVGIQNELNDWVECVQVICSLI